MNKVFIGYVIFAVILLIASFDNRNKKNKGSIKEWFRKRSMLYIVMPIIVLYVIYE